MNKTDKSDLSVKRQVVKKSNSLSLPKEPLDLYRELSTVPKNPFNPKNKPVPVHHAAGLPPVFARQRWGLWPVEPVPLATERPPLDEAGADLLTAYIRPQPVAVIRWVCAQAERYDEARPDWQPPALCELSASLDCALWQLEKHLTGATRAERAASLLSMLDSNTNPEACRR